MTHSKFVFVAALAAGLVPMGAIAQATAAPAETPAAAAPATAPAASVPAAATAPETAPAADSVPAAPAPAAAAPAHPAPQAYPAKIALVAFQQAVMATNEGRSTMAKVQTKYQPKQTALEALNAEVEKLKKDMQAAPATTTDAERATRMKTLDSKQKELDQQTEEARTAYQADLQAAYAKVAEKVHKTLLDYVQTNGYTILFDVSSDQSPVVWAQPSPSADITLAVVDAYNASSGVAAPAAGAPAAVAKPKAGAAAAHAAGHAAGSAK